MSRPVENIFAGAAASPGRENAGTLFENAGVKIERIVSDSYSSPAGFWYDQAEDEWVLLLRGGATLEFAGGEIVEMKAGDHATIPRRVKHRVQRTGAETIWLAVRVRSEQ